MSLVAPIARAALLPALVAAVVLSGVALTYRPAVDGASGGFFLVLAIAALGAAGAIAWSLIRGWRPLVLLGLLLAMLAPPVVVHGLRVVRANAVVGVSADHPQALERLFAPALRDGAALQTDGDALELRVPARSTGYLEARIPLLAGAARAGPLHQLLPRALWDGRRPDLVGEELRFRAQVVRYGSYFVVAELDRLDLQAVAGGVLVTPPPTPGQPVVARHVPVSADLSAWQDWSFRRSRGELSVSIAGQPVWSGPALRAFERLRLGETRTGDDHGGILRVRSVAARRFVSSMS